VAIARALANDPPIIVADEPTGNLDSKTAESVFRLFEDLVNDGKTILMVTHDHDLAKRATRTVILTDGAVAEIGQVVRARIMENVDRTEERERA
jgi:putative ABC transport system ATP-binding protein